VRRDLILTAGLLLALAAAIWLCCPADAADLRVEGGTIAALNSDCDLGLAVSVGTELPTWVPVIGGETPHLLFVDCLTVNTQQAIGLSVSIRPAADDDGWRIGATVTQPETGQREVLGYIRYGVSLW
jgi:hypothetical protein